MSDHELKALTDAARAYEGLHVPALFQEWVGPVLDAAGVAPGDRVLDVACGTGVLSRAASTLVGTDGHVVGIDPGVGMLAAAKEIAPGIDYRAGVAEELPFDDASFDAVVSQFGLMFFTDRGRAIREMLRVLVPGKRLAVAVWDSLERTPAYAGAVAMLAELAGSAAADALRAPFVLGDPDALRTMFEDAGVEGVTVATRTGTARFPSLRTMVEADLRGWLPIMGVNLSDPQVESILAEAEVRLAEYVTPEGHAVFDSPAHIVSGSKPEDA